MKLCQNEVWQLNSKYLKSCLLAGCTFNVARPCFVFCFFCFFWGGGGVEGWDWRECLCFHISFEIKKVYWQRKCAMFTFMHLVNFYFFAKPLGFRMLKSNNSSASAKPVRKFKAIPSSNEYTIFSYYLWKFFEWKLAGVAAA